jgi:hypothetical protein
MSRQRLTSASAYVRRMSATWSRPLYQLGSGGHRHLDVLGAHGDDGVDVVSLPGIDVALDELAQLVVAEEARVVDRL